MRKCLIACLVVALLVGVTYWRYVTEPAFQHPKYSEQAASIAYIIGEQDRTVNVHWGVGRGKILISVYEITDEGKQNRIVELIESLKAKGLVDCPVMLNFYERENWIGTPKNERGIGDWHRGPEKLIRSAKL